MRLPLVFTCAAALAGFAGGVQAGPRAVAAGADTPARVRQAIVDAVRSRMGDDADVVVDGLALSTTADYAILQAVPPPDARLGDRIHFRLLGTDGAGESARPAGSASAVVLVDVAHVRATALVPRGRDLADGDIEASHASLSGVPLRRLPTLSEVAGARTLVPLAPGEVLTRTTIAARPAVKTGQAVRATARIGGLEVTATLVAAQDGAPGSIIRVVNKESRRELRARVIGSGAVEVLP